MLVNKYEIIFISKFHKKSIECIGNVKTESFMQLIRERADTIILDMNSYLWLMCDVDEMLNVDPSLPVMRQAIFQDRTSRLMDAEKNCNLETINVL